MPSTCPSLHILEGKLASLANTMTDSNLPRDAQRCPEGYAALHADACGPAKTDNGPVEGEAGCWGICVRRDDIIFEMIGDIEHIKINLAMWPMKKSTPG